MAESSSLFRDAEGHVNAVIMAFPAGLTLKLFLEEYESLVGRPLPFRDLGFEAPLDLLCSMPKSIKVMELKNRDILLKAVPNNSNAHVFELVKGQQKQKSRSVKHTKRIVQSSLSLKSSARSVTIPVSPLAPNISTTPTLSVKPVAALSVNRSEDSTSKLSTKKTVHTTRTVQQKTATGSRNSTNSPEHNQRNTEEFRDGTSQSPVPWVVRGSPAAIPYEDFRTDLQSQGFVFVQIAEIFHPENFWWYLLQRRADIEKLSDDMKEFYENIDTEDSFRLQHCQLYLGQYVAAKYGVDNLWYRAKILSFGFDMVTNVLFVDYGTLDDVCIEDMRRLEAQFTQLPIQGRRGRLSSVAPNTPCQKKWSREASQYFRNLVYNKGLVAYFANMDPQSEHKEGDYVYDVILVDTSQSDVFLADQLIEMHYATLRVQPDEDGPILPEENQVVDANPESQTPLSPENISEQRDIVVDSDVDEILSLCQVPSPSSPFQESDASQDVTRSSTFMTSSTQRSDSTQPSDLMNRCDVPPAPVMQRSSAPGHVIPACSVPVYPPVGYVASPFVPPSTAVPSTPLRVPPPSPMMLPPSVLAGQPLVYRGMSPILQGLWPARFPLHEHQQMGVLHQRLTPAPTVPFPDLLVNLNGAIPSSSPRFSSPAPQLIPPGILPDPGQSIAWKPTPPCGFNPAGQVKLIRLGSGYQLHLVKTRGVFHLPVMEVFEQCSQFTYVDDMEWTLRLRQVALPVRCSAKEDPDLFFELVQCNVPWLTLKPTTSIESFNAYRLDYAVAILRIFGAKNESVLSILEGELGRFSGN